MEEALFLLLLPDLEPDLDQDDAGIDDVFFDDRAILQEILVLRIGSKPAHRPDKCGFRTALPVEQIAGLALAEVRHAVKPQPPPAPA